MRDVSLSLVLRSDRCPYQETNLHDHPETRHRDLSYVLSRSLRAQIIGSKMAIGEQIRLIAYESAGRVLNRLMANVGRTRSSRRRVVMFFRVCPIVRN